MNIDSFLKTRYRIGALWILSLLLIVPLVFFSLLWKLENQVYDNFCSLKGGLPTPPEILLVGIDEPSFQEFRLSWPWPRSLHARLIDRLSAAGARLIIFNIVFADPSSPENDAALASAIKRAGNVVLAEDIVLTDDSLFKSSIRSRPIGAFADACKGTGLAKIALDNDGVVRHFHAWIMGLPTLPARAVDALGKTDLPRDTNGLIKFAGPARSIDTLSYYQILDEEHPVPAERIRNRIVLVGHMVEASATLSSQSDYFTTPFFESSPVRISGIEIYANIIHDLLTGQWVKEIPITMKLIACLGYFLLFSLLFAAISPLYGLTALVASSLGLTALSYWFFRALDFWFPPVTFVLGTASIYTGNVVLQYLAEAHNRRRLRAAFNRYLSPVVVESIVKDPGSLELGGQEVQATIFFSDLANFTTFSERLTPKELVAFLIEYFAPMTKIILDRRGYLDKFIGDAIMAVWGVPLPSEKHAEYACEAALQMKKSLAGLREDWNRRNLPLLTARMGIHSGPVVAGNIGSMERINYTVLGDTVNLASRLEGANKLYGTTILISEDTFQLAGPAFLTREIDSIRVKGRQAPVRIYELIGKRGEEQLPFLDTFAQGLADYKNRMWERAELLFASIASQDPPSGTYLERCRHYKTDPPPEDWDGVFTHKTK